jgi:hypothetical protein
MSRSEVSAAIAEVIRTTLHDGMLDGDSPETARYIATQSDLLARIVVDTPESQTPFLVVGLRRTRIELGRLARVAKQPAKRLAALDALHAPAIELLAADHVMRGDLGSNSALAKAAALAGNPDLAKALAEASNPDSVKAAEEAALAWLATMAVEAALKRLDDREREGVPAPAPTMKPENLQADAFAGVLAATYEELTGRPAHHVEGDRGGGSYLALLAAAAEAVAALETAAAKAARAEGAAEAAPAIKLRGAVKRARKITTARRRRKSEG